MRYAHRLRPAVASGQQPAHARRRGSDSTPRSPSEAALDLQRTAGNRAVAGLLGGRLTVQRHKGTEPEIAAAHVVSSAEEADMPDAADTPALGAEKADLLGERAPIATRLKAARKHPDPADAGRLKEIDDRLVEIDGMLGLRVKGDEAVTLEHNNYTAGTAAWFADVHTITFLGRSATVHKLLAERLARAEKALDGMPKPPGGWVSEEHSTLRPPGQSLHSFGLAIDLNPHTNPFLVKPTGTAIYEPTAWSIAIRDVIERAALLVLGRTAADEAFFSRPDVKDKDARVEASYDKVAEMSTALQRYLALADDGQAAELNRLVADLADKDPRAKGADAWKKQILADRKKMEELAGQKHWTNPKGGFLDLDKRLVKAMTDSAGAGLTWLGDDTVSPGRDIMHFDMRAVGPIRKIWSSAERKDTHLGDG